ncbi:NrsF family protein [Enterobacteriaceae bacterium C34A]
MADHNALISGLGRRATPVKRVKSVGWRMFLWTIIALPCGALASLLVSREATDWTQSGALLAAIQLLLAFVTGQLAIRNAFTLSIAGRRGNGWRLFLPLLLVWLTTLGLSFGHQPLHIDKHDTQCFTFMVTVSVPMIALVILWLRQTRTLTPLSTLLCAGAGVACMAVTLLSFCHPVHLHPVDLLMHVAAFTIIVGATALAGWRWVKV